MKDSAFEGVTWFAACDNLDLRTLKSGDSFELCQAGYSDRRLVWDEIFE